MKTGLEDKYVIKDNKKLALGYTTGSCAAGAAKAAAIMAFTGESLEYVSLLTPKGILLNLELHDIDLENVKNKEVSCAIKKFSGDDPDVTNGILVYAKLNLEKDLSLNRTEVIIEGGTGVGRITKPGLEQNIGEAAINSVPRKMIRDEVLAVCEENDFLGRARVTISIPEGVELAKRTINPRLGIEGGISVLGTSGIVEPMSEEALKASIRLEMSMKKKNGADYLIITPGNYGTAYLKTALPVSGIDALKCSNYVGETIDMVVELGYKGILFVSHIGKFIKLAAGIMNTHSRWADARMEIMAANALRAGAPKEVCLEILDAMTTDEGISILKREDLLESVMKLIMDKILFYLDNRAYGKLKLGVIVFSNEHGELGKAGCVEELIEDVGNFIRSGDRTGRS